MDKQEVLAQAGSIARNARAAAERVELEQTVTEFERSPERALRSLASAYRMLQRPFR